MAETRKTLAAILAEAPVGSTGGITAQDYRDAFFSVFPHTATRDPDANDDSSGGYDVGSSWVNTDNGKAWICTDNTDGAAEWAFLGIPNVEDLTEETNLQNPSAAPSAYEVLVFFDNANPRYARADVVAGTNARVMSTDPTVNDDETADYFVPYFWINTSTNAVYVLVDATAGAAVWVDLSATGGGGGTSGDGNQLVLYETGDGVWRDGATGDPRDRDVDTITEWYSAGENMAVLPPRNATTGMRNIDRYERLGPAPSILCVMGDPAIPTASEEDLLNKFEEMGFTLNQVSSSFTLPSVGDYSFIWISYSADQTQFPPGLPILEIPIACNLREFLGDLGMAANEADVSVTGNDQTTIDVTDDTTEATGDVSAGVVTIYGTAGNIQHALTSTLPTEANVLATLDGQPDRACFVTYPASIALEGGVGFVNARRMYPGFFTKPQRYSSDGELLFRSATYWIAGFDY